jgi:hypothetical protein
VIDPMSDACLNPGGDPNDPPPDDGTGIDFPDGSNDINPDEFFNDLEPDHLGDFTDENFADFDPEAVHGFTEEHFENFDPEAVDGFTQEHLENFDPMAVGGFTEDHLHNLDPDAVDGFTEEHFANFDPMAFAGFTDEHIDNFDPSVIDDIPPEGFGNLGHDAIESFTPEQFMELSPEQLAAMDSDNMGGFSPEIIQNMGDEILDSFDPELFRELPDEDFSKMMTNFDPNEFSPEELVDFVPDDWELDPDTGELVAPPGALLSFKDADDSALLDGVDLPDLPDLNTGLAIGGVDPDGTVIDGLDNVMDDAGFGILDFSQENGILQLGDNDTIGLEAAFIPDPDGIKQADADAKPGLFQDSTGKFILITDDGYQIPLIPALKDPEDILATEPGSTIVVGDEGEIFILLEGENPIVGIAKLAVKDADPDLEPGVHQTGEGENKEVIIVYADGTAQKLKPAMQSPAEFVDAAVIWGMDVVEFNTNGTIDVIFDGEDLTVVPLFDVEPGEPETIVAPSISEEAGNFFFTNSVGNKQQFLLGT